jgi:hypothetical protein
MRFLFAKRASLPEQLANLCFKVRCEAFQSFLDDYVAKGFESSDALRRLEFSKDVLVIFLASHALQVRMISNHQRFLQINESVRRHYLTQLPVPPSSLIGDCFICEDEIKAIADFAAPGAPLSQVRTTPASTIGLISFATDYRAAEFREDIIEGLHRQSTVGSGMWLPAARTFLKRIRGVPRESIPFDHVNHFSITLLLPFMLISETVQKIPT